VTLQYLDRAAIGVWGPVTGRRYDFSEAQPLRAVDIRDAALLARGGPFRRGA
jgi:hypothetical protein